MTKSNCEMCKHKQHPDGGWCYMFRYEPTSVCTQHSMVAVNVRNLRMAYVEKLIKKEQQ